jgi:hypothetical protein
VPSASSLPICYNQVVPKLTSETTSSLLFEPKETVIEDETQLDLYQELLTELYTDLEDVVRKLGNRVQELPSREDQLNELLVLIGEYIEQTVPIKDKSALRERFINFASVGNLLVEPLTQLVFKEPGSPKLIVGLERDGQLLRMVVQAIVEYFNVENVKNVPFFASRSFFEKTLQQSINPEQAQAILHKICQDILNALNNDNLVEIVETGYNGTVIVELEEFILQLTSPEKQQALLQEAIQLIKDKNIKTVVVSGTHSSYFAHDLRKALQESNLLVEVYEENGPRSYIGTESADTSAHAAQQITESVMRVIPDHNQLDNPLIIDTNSRYRTTVEDWQRIFSNLHLHPQFEFLGISEPLELPKLHSSMLLSYTPRIDEMFKLPREEHFFVMERIEMSNHLFDEIKQANQHVKPELKLRGHFTNDEEYLNFLYLFLVTRVGLLVGAHDRLKLM